jgi:beta-ribofuranosylaminobenzene 5'-phosphate synthase
MALDPRAVTTESSGICRAGEVVVAVGLYRRVTVITSQDKAISVSKTSQYPALIRHGALLMKQALGFDKGLDIHMEAEFVGKHCGLGSSSATLTAVGCAINELCGRPLDADTLTRYLVENHGEEIDGDDAHLFPVQCIGGSAVAGTRQGGVLVIAGECTLIGSMQLGPDYRAVIGIPSDYRRMDAAEAMARETQNFAGFNATGERYAAMVSFRLVHEVLPAMAKGELQPLGDLVEAYRYEMGSIDNCSFSYPGLAALAARLRPIKTSGLAEMLSLSSVGPAMFAITRNPEAVAKAFQAQSLDVQIVPIHNGVYSVEEGP